MQRHLMFGDADGDGLDTSRTAEIGDARHSGDVGYLFARLDLRMTHGGTGDIDELDAGKCIRQQSGGNRE